MKCKYSNSTRSVKKWYWCIPNIHSVFLIGQEEEAGGVGDVHEADGQSIQEGRADWHAQGDDSVSPSPSGAPFEIASQGFCSSQTSYWSRRFTWCAWLLTGCTVTAFAASRTCLPSPCRCCLPSAARSPRSASTKPTSLGCFSGACLLYFSETEKHCLGNQSCVMSQRAPHLQRPVLYISEGKFNYY